MYQSDPVTAGGSHAREAPGDPSADVRCTHTSAVARLANVIVDPFTAFRGIDARPTWALALAALVALRFGSLFAFYHPDVTPAKLVAGVLFQLLSVMPALVVLTVVLWVVARVWRTGLSWSSTLSVTVHAMFAYTLLTVLVASLAGALLPASADVDLRNPPFTNPGALAGDGASVIVRALLRAADIRMAYAFALVYLGVAAVLPGGGRRRAACTVATCAVLHLVAAAGMAIARGG